MEDERKARLLLPNASKPYFATFERSLRERLYNDTSSYFIEKGMEDGENDLLDLAMNDAREACLLFSHDTKSWYNTNIGYKKRSKSTISRVNGNDMVDFNVSLGGTQFFVYTEDLGKRISHYHTHPVEADVLFFVSLLDVLDRKTDICVPDGKLAEMQRRFYKRGGLLLQNVLPSVEDLGTYAHMSRYHDHGMLDFKIVSAYGITTVRVNGPLDEKILQKYKQCKDTVGQGVAPQNDREVRDGISKAVERMNETNPALYITMEFHGGFDYDRLLEIQSSRIVRHLEDRRRSLLCAIYRKALGRFL